MHSEASCSASQKKKHVKEISQVT